MARCRYCNKEITWMKDGRKNVPVEHDGAVHKCDEMINARNSFRKITPTDVDPELLKQYEKAINEKASKTKKKS